MTIPAPSSFGCGVIAAGHGTRLKAEGYRSGKAMTVVCGRPLIDHALERFRAVGASRATVIINEDSQDCRQWLERGAGGLDLEVIVQTTASSYVSFDIVAARLAGRPAFLTTVDSIAPVEDARRFIRSAAAAPRDAVVLGVTSHVDDEKPLWATLDDGGRIHGLGASGGNCVTAGFYWLPAIRPPAPPSGFERLRDYLVWFSHRAPIYGVRLSTVFDIDRGSDVQAAERAAKTDAREGIDS